MKAFCLLALLFFLVHACPAVEPPPIGEYSGIIKVTKVMTPPLEFQPAGITTAGTSTVSYSVSAKATVTKTGHIFILTAAPQSPSSVPTNPAEGLIKVEYLPNGAVGAGTPDLPSFAPGSYRVTGIPAGSSLAKVTTKGNLLTISYQKDTLQWGQLIDLNNPVPHIAWGITATLRRSPRQPSR